MSPVSRRETPPIEAMRAANGLTLIVKENHSSPIVSLAAYFRGGVPAEDEASLGITSFVQRMLMKGTARRDAEAVAADLEFLGASMSPFTGKDVFGASLTCLSKHFPSALSVFSDCLLHACMPAEAADLERRVIVRDIERRKDDSLSFCLELCEKALFEGHPYRFPISGTVATLSQLTVDDLQAWHARFYRPDRMVIAVVGDIDAASARALVLDAFAQARPSDEALPPSPLLPPLAGVRECRETREKRQSAVALGFHAPSFGHPDEAAFEVLEHVLSGMGSRLFIELRDKQGLGYVVNAHHDPRLDAGAFKIYISTSEERRARAREAMMEQVARLRDERVGPEELERTRQYMLGLYEISQQRNGAQASRLAYYEVMGQGWRALEAWPARIQGVQAADVQAAAQRYLDPERHALAQVLSG